MCTVYRVISASFRAFDLIKSGNNGGNMPRGSLKIIYAMIKIVDHHLVSARQLISPNHSARPEDVEINLLVIHSISLPPGEFGGPYIDDLFCNRLDCTIHEFFNEIADLKVSSHLMISRNGEITQYVPFNQQAWHAGKSFFEGDEQCNEFSIGIELEGTEKDEFTGSQYDQLKRVTQAIMDAYPGITLERIAGHSDIAPGRKTDPGPGFDWSRYRKALQA